MNERERLAEQQAGLLRALLAGGEAPAGFDPRTLAAERKLLRDKRRRIVAYLSPELEPALGERFAGLFDAYAEAHPPVAGQRARADAAAFTDWLAARGERVEPEAGERRSRWLPWRRR